MPDTKNSDLGCRSVERACFHPAIASMIPAFFQKAVPDARLVIWQNSTEGARSLSNKNRVGSRSENTNLVPSGDKVWGTRSALAFLPTYYQCHDPELIMLILLLGGIGRQSLTRIVSSGDTSHSISSHHVA